METIRIDTGKSYQVHIGPGLIKECGFLLLKNKPSLVAIITDSTVASLYLEPTVQSLKAAGNKVVTYIFPAGEHAKNIATWGDILHFFAQAGLTREDMVIALGGGVCGDLAGFAAGCYMRGLSYVQMPTTLLAAVDSSVGGKTAVNLPAGKNMAGLFIQPRAVLCDVNTFATLPSHVYAEGLAEAIKMGILSGESLFSLLEKQDAKERLVEIIKRCVAFKGEVVAKDEYEAGLRQTLNLGHTVAHAIEKCSDYTVSHGYGVAIGTAVISRGAAKLGWSPRQCSRRIIRALVGAGLPVETEYSAGELAQAALADKKRKGDEITLVIPEDIGNCRLKTVPVVELQSIIEAGLE